jgi:hypothetical protein
MKLSRFVFVPLLFVLTGCMTGIDSAVFLPAPPAPEQKVIRIYQTQLPTCRYEELGMITWKRPHGFMKLQKGVELMRERARRMGGDAIVAFQVGERENGITTTTRVDSTSVVTSSSLDRDRIAAGTVVRFTEPGCQ